MSQPPPGGAPERHDLSILIFAPTSNDARLTGGFLEKAGFGIVVCTDVAAAVERLPHRCGALLLAEEALAQDAVHLLVARLGEQPSWSDLPIIIITGRGAAERWSPRYLQALGPVGNITIIERPVRPETLVSTCQVALRSRRRQYQVRDLLEEREAAVRNISEAREQYRESQMRLHFAMAAAHIGDWDLNLLDDTSRRSLLHDQAFGYTQPVEQWGFQVMIQRVHEDDRSEVMRRFYATVAGEGDLHFEARVVWPDQSVHWIAVHGSLYRDSRSRPTRMLGIIMDITPRKEAEQALLQQAAALRESDQRKDEFLAMLAHELRNPLAAVANAVAVLQTVAAEDHRWAAGVITRQSAQLSRLIDDLLDVSRINTGKVRLRREVLDVATILDRARDSVQPLMTERSHAFTCEYPRETLWIDADATRIEQIILNLLTNAAKYTPAGGRIALTAKMQGSKVSISVEDNGIGIAPERMPEMFQLFAQGERSIARSEGGLGIGLTIVQKLVEMHGGRVDAYSDGPNHGSTFAVSLPTAKRRPARAAQPAQNLTPPIPTPDLDLNSPSTDAATALSSSATDGTEPHTTPGAAANSSAAENPSAENPAADIGANAASTPTAASMATAPPTIQQSTSPHPSRRILIVDDNIDTAQGLSRILRRAGHVPEMAHDGLQALELARDFAPQAIILDIGLPGMDGLEVVQRLRQESFSADAIMIAVTGYGQPADRHRALQAGFDHHLVKPVDLEKLMTLLVETRTVQA